MCLTTEQYLTLLQIENFYTEGIYTTTFALNFTPL